MASTTTSNETSEGFIIDWVKKAIVTLSFGQLEDTSQEGAFIFKDVPIARPLVVERHWLSSRPVEPWYGVL
jgi:carboxylesterase type B